MAQIKPFHDEYGVIHEADKILPTDELKVKLVGALAELQDNECYVKRSFPKTRLHRVKGVKQNVYRADVDKISGWRLHAQLSDGVLYLKDIIPGQNHDDVSKVIKAKKHRYS